MNIRSFLISTGTSASLIFLTSVSAAPLTGEYTVSFDSELAVFDTSGTYEESLDEGSISIDMKYSMSTDASGKVVGTGTFSARDKWAGLTMDGNIRLAGSVKSAGEVIRVSLAFALDGNFTIQGYDGNVTAALKASMELDKPTRTLNGTMSGSMRISMTVDGKTARESVRLPKTSFSATAPESADGEWVITLYNVETNGKKITGEGIAELGYDNSFNLKVTGSYNAKSDTSRITLTGMTSKAKVTLSCNDEDDNLIYYKVKGKVMGQNIKY